MNKNSFLFQKLSSYCQNRAILRKSDLTAPSLLEAYLLHKLLVIFPKSIFLYSPNRAIYKLKSPFKGIKIKTSKNKCKPIKAKTTVLKSRSFQL